MDEDTLNRVPDDLKGLRQWVIWRYVGKDRRKTPFTPSGNPAKANDIETWSNFQDCLAGFREGRDEGLGFEFSRDDPFCGVDFDNCRDPKSGVVEDWAREIIKKMDTYSEVSPSGTGVKLWCKGKSPFPTGRQIVLGAARRIEVYEWGRYFAVTGLRLSGVSSEIESRDLSWLTGMVCSPTRLSDVERARMYISKIPGAKAGMGGHNATFHVACCLVLGFDLSPEVSMPLILNWNMTCDPPWTEGDLHHKLSDASKQPGPRGYLSDGSTPRSGASVLLPEKESKLARDVDILIKGLEAICKEIRSEVPDSKAGEGGQGSSSDKDGVSGKQ